MSTSRTSRSKSRITNTTILISLIAMTGLTIGLNWVYNNLINSSTGNSNDNSEDAEDQEQVLSNDKNIKNKKELLNNKKSNKPILCLATSILPLPSLLKLLSQSYTLHLLILSSHPFKLSSRYTDSMDSRRILFYEKSEGLIHLVRSLGGILIVVDNSKGLEGERVEDLALEVTEEVEVEVVENGKAVESLVKIDKLIKEVRTFVKFILVLVKLGEEEKVRIELNSGSNNDSNNKLRVIGGWESLNKVLGL